jgi:ubiquinone biosynthesis accessory factor UbiK
METLHRAYAPSRCVCCDTLYGGGAFAGTRRRAHNRARKDAHMLGRLIDQITATVARLAPAQLGAEAERNLRGALASLLERAELVTREELEVQEAVLARTRERLRTLETRVAELEQQLHKKN